MTPDDLKGESFEEFKNSFSYGSRADLNFKFLRSLSNEEAARFFQELLWKLGDSLDDGQFDRIVEHVRQWQARGYGGTVRGWTYDEGPFTALRKPISESRLTLPTSSGHFVQGDDPQPFGVQGMTQEEALGRITEFLKTEPALSSIPKDTPREMLRARHGAMMSVDHGLIPTWYSLWSGFANWRRRGSLASCLRRRTPSWEPVHSDDC